MEKIKTIVESPNQFAESLIAQGDSGDLEAVASQLEEHIKKLAEEDKKNSVQL